MHKQTDGFYKPSSTYSVGHAVCVVTLAVTLLFSLDARASVDLAWVLVSSNGVESKPYIHAEAACLQGFGELASAFPDNYIARFHAIPSAPHCTLHHRLDPDFTSPRAELTLQHVTCPEGHWLNLADGECVAPQFFVTTPTALTASATPSDQCPRCDLIWANAENTLQSLGDNPRPQTPAVITDWGVNLVTGERIIQEIDFRSYGAHPLLLVRQYHSHNLIDSGLGPGWQHQYMRQARSEFAPVSPRYDGEAPTFSLSQPTQKEACERGWRDVRAHVKDAGLRFSIARFEQGMCSLFVNSHEVGRVALHSTLGIPLATAFNRHQEMEGAVFDSRQAWTAVPPVVAVLAQRPDGGVVRFVRDTRDGWRAPSSSGYRLRDSSDGRVLTTPMQTQEHYFADGRLNAIVNRAGMRLQMGYDGNQRLVKVTNHFGTQITFEYDESAHLIGATDSAGLRYTYQYDDKGRLLSVGYPDHVSRRYGHNDETGQGLLTYIIDESNQIADRWEYDASRRVTMTESALGTQRRTYQYHDDDNTAAVQESDGATYSLRFNRIAGRPLVEEIDYSDCTSCNRGKQSIQYNNDGLPTLIRDFSGLISQVEYVPETDLPRRVAELAGDRQRLTLWRWDLEKRLLTCQTTDNLTTEYVYDDRGLLTRRTQFDTADPTLFKVAIVARNCTTLSQRLDRDKIPTRSWSYTYTSDGLTATEDGPRTDVADFTQYVYNDAGNLQRIMNAAQHVVEFMRYDGRGLPHRTLDANGVAIDRNYDSRGRILYETRVSESGNFTTTYEYNSSGQLARETAPNGAYLNYHYDNAHRLTGVTNQFGERVNYTRDMLGRSVQETLRDRSGALTQRVAHRYDELGRVVEITRGDRIAARLKYDKAGHMATMTDSLNNQTLYAHDGFGNLIHQTDTMNQTLEYTYDSQNRPITAKDARGNTTTFSYDGFGNIRSSISPDSGRITYAYDTVGNLIEQIDARGIHVRFSYDSLNRLVGKYFPASPGENTTYRYDERLDGNPGIGFLTSLRDGTGTTRYRYDDLGHLTHEQRVTDDIHYTLRYHYDETGALKRLIYPSGRRVDYVRDLQGRITHISTHDRDGDAPRVLAHDMVYDPSGALLAMSFGNGLFSRRQFDSEHRLAAIQTLSSLLQLQNLRIHYDATGNVLNITDGITPRRSQEFRYDNLHRLIAARGHYGDVQYRYDAAGNRIHRSRHDGRTVNTENYVYATDSNRLLRLERGGDHALSTRSFTHDATGNTLLDLRGTLDKLIFTYDDNNRLINAQRGKHQASYWHNGLGQRTMKIVDGHTQHFHYDPAGNLLAETDADGRTLREYVYAENQRIAMITAPIHRTTARLPADMIIDSEQDRTLKQGTWQSEQSATGYIGSNYLIQSSSNAKTDLAGGVKAGQRVAWPISVLESGEYAVHILWTSHPDRTSRAYYSVSHANGNTHIELDQRREGGTWQSLGRFTFRRGQRYEISVTARAPGNLVADAVKLSWAGTQLPVETTAAVFYYHNDLLGTPEILSDDHQNIVWSADISPFGETVETATLLRQPLRLQGQYQDSETGLHYNYYRDYDPSLGRYIESDPTGLQGGANTYAYVLPNPMRGVDPLGLSARLTTESDQAINPDWLDRSHHDNSMRITWIEHYPPPTPVRPFTRLGQLNNMNRALLPRTPILETLTPHH